MHRIALVLIFLATILVAALVGTAGPAQATYPGANGKLAFVSTETGNPDIFTINANGTGTTNLTANSTAVDVSPDWSPNGQKIVFLSRRDANNNREIYVMDANGSHQTRLTNNPALDVSPSWSPNGKQILFASTRDGNFEIYLMDADGTKVRRITDNSAFDAAPSFSPRGDKIVFQSDRSGAFAVWVMSAEGTGARQLTPDELGAVLPDWSPNGKEIAFHNNCCVEENSDILVVNTNSKNVRHLTENFDNNLDPSWSPDGQKIAFDHGIIDFSTGEFSTTDLYVMNSDGTGSPTQLTNTPTVSEMDPDWGSG
jgi:Tol biopolymer transport system component